MRYRSSRTTIWGNRLSPPRRSPMMCFISVRPPNCGRLGAKNVKVGPRSAARNPELYFREVRVGFYLGDLLGVPFAVAGDEEHPLVGIKLLPQRTVGRMLPE